MQQIQSDKHILLFAIREILTQYDLSFDMCKVNKLTYCFFLSCKGVQIIIPSNVIKSEQNSILDGW